MTLKDIDFSVEMYGTTPIIQSNYDVAYTGDESSINVKFTITDEPELTGATAIVHLKFADSSHIERSLELTESIFSYTLKGTENKHAGVVRADIIITKGGAKFTRAGHKFKIDTSLDASVPLIEYAVDTLDTLVDGAEEWLLQTQIDFGIAQSQRAEEWVADNDARADEFAESQTDRTNAFDASEAARTTDFNASETGRSNTFTVNENAREAAAESGEAARGESFELSEYERATTFGESEAGRVITFNGSEADRTIVFNLAEAARSEGYTEDHDRAGTDHTRAENDHDIALTDQENYDTLLTNLQETINDANENIAEFDVALQNGIVATNIAAELQNLEETYAPNIVSLTSQLAEAVPFIDKNTPKLTNAKINNLFRQAKDGLADVNYIMVGDSTRASNGAHIYAMVSPILQALSVTTTLQAQSGLKAQHWSSSDDTIQPGYPQASDLIALIPGTGVTTIIDICLGINDNVHTVAEIKGYLKVGIDLIKASKPDVLFNLTSPNIRNSTEFYKLPIVYKELTSENAYGYINVSENVWKSWADTTGYFIDNDHPNEYGQKKMGEYILSKLVAEDLRLMDLSNIPVPKGSLSELTINDPIRASGIRVEVIYTTGATTGVLYLRKLSDNRWYLYDALTGDSVSGAITMKNGQQTISTGFVVARKLTALITIRDYTILDSVAYGATYYPLENYLVTTFTKNKTQSRALYDISADYSNHIKPTLILKGTIDNTDANYAALKAAGLRIELRQTVGTPFTNLYLKKSATGKWGIYPQTSGDQISNDLLMVSGFNDVAKVSWNTTSDFECKVYIDDHTVFNSFANTTSYIKLKNALVSELSVYRSIRQHIAKLYDMVLGNP